MSIIFVNNKPTLQTNITDSGVRTSETLSTFIGQYNFNFITNPSNGNSTAVISPPTLSLSSSETFTNIESGTILGTDIVDTNGGSQTITVNVTGGTVSLATLTGLTGSGNGTNSLTYSGTLTNINTAIASLSFTHNLGLDGGSASIEIMADNGYGTDTKTCEITISAFAPLTMVLSVSSSVQFIMPLANEPANFEVDWGDGNINTYTSHYPVAHTYATTGYKTIEIRGVMPRWDFTTNPTHKDKLSGISSWGDVEWSSMAGAFADCDGLVLIGTGVIRTTDVSNAWKGCTNLTTFGASDFTSVENISHAWENCIALSTFSVTNFPAVTNASYAWKGCSSLTGVPVYTMPACTNFSYTWANSAVIAIHETSDLSAGTNFSHAWESCSSLIASALDLSSGTNFSYAWKNTNLTDFTSDVSSGTDFTATWNNCGVLSTFNPTGGLTFGQHFDNAWENCGNLSEFGPYSFTNGQTFNAAWKNCNTLVSFTGCQFPSATTFVEAWSGAGINTWDLGYAFPEALDMSYAWMNCTGMSTFNPISIPKTTNLNYAWFGCISLTVFPTITYTLVESVYATWQGCVGLTSFPDISLPSVSGTGLTSTWQGCTSLVTMNNVSATTADSLTRTWKNCYSMESIGTLTFVSLTSMNSTFEECNSLTSIPSLGNLSSLLNMTSTWYGCGSLQDIGTFDTDQDCTYDNIVGNCYALESFGLDNIYTNINFRECSLSNTAINTIFGNLVTVDPTQTINIAGNPGTYTCDTSIATGKGWTVVPDAPVSIESADEHWIAENSSSPIVELTAVGATGGTIVFNVVAGVGDYALFDIDVENQLFAISPGLDYEAWTDANGDGVYSIRVRATDGYGEDFLDLSISPTDVNEELAGSWTQFYTNSIESTTLYLDSFGTMIDNYDGYRSLKIYKTDQNSFDHDFDSSYVGRLIRLVHISSGTNQIYAIVEASYADPVLALTLTGVTGITNGSFPIVSTSDVILVEMLDNSTQLVMYNATSGYFNVYPGATNRNYNDPQSTVANDFSANAINVDGYAVFNSGSTWKRFLYWLDPIITPEANSTNIDLQYSTNLVPTLTKVAEGYDGAALQFTVSMGVSPGYSQYSTYDANGGSENQSNITFDEYGYIVDIMMNGTYTLIYGGIGYTYATYSASTEGYRNSPIYSSGVALSFYIAQQGVTTTTEQYTLVTLPSGFSSLTGGYFRFQAASVNTTFAVLSNNDPQTIQDRIRELVGWGGANVNGAGTVSDPYTISAGANGSRNDLSIVDNSLMGNTDPSFSATYQRTNNP